MVVVEGITQRMLRIVARLNNLPRGFYNKGNQYLLDGLAAALAVYVAFELRFDHQVPASFRPLLWAWMASFALARPLAMRLTGADSSIWRYFSLRDVPRLLLSAALPSTFLLAFRVTALPSARWHLSLPISIIVMDYGIFLLLAVALRGTRRAGFEAARDSAPRRRTLIIGSGATLAAAARQVSVHPEMQLAAFLTPSAELHGHNIAGIPVLGAPEDFSALAARTHADLALVSDVTLPELGTVVETATDLGIEIRMMPSAENILRGDARVSTAPNADDALPGRTAQAIVQNDEVKRTFEGRSVLVTGAGGSIGSEIARQVASLDVRRLILLDHDETALFEIDRELRENGCGKHVVVVGDIRDRGHLETIFEQTKPDIVLHAAAYKHVPIMEANAPEAVLNNVIGTREVLETAFAFGSERFVMISTDKAVHPSSIMGATKRVAEQIVQSRALRCNGSLKTHCACVRFGNVLGSRGSVVPIFLSQIMAGGPLTITDEQMTRYFMTIAEAVRLVLQATTLADHGDVFMLDMGDPVKITTLARKLIEMSGLQPGKDIEIKFTGRRPGEKLHEQLWRDGTTVLPTPVENISMAAETVVPPDFEAQLERLEAAARARNHAAAARQVMQMAGASSVHAVPVKPKATGGIALAVDRRPSGGQERPTPAN